MPGYSDVVMGHFRNPPNVGELLRPDAPGAAGGAALTRF